MAKLSKYIRWYTQEEEPKIFEDFTITPVSQTLAVQSPYFYFAWKRPAAVKIKNGNESKRLRILDLTRIVQLGIGMVGFTIMLLYWRYGSR